ncbi:hypothetical protein [Limnohabitans sp.]
MKPAIITNSVAPLCGPPWGTAGKPSPNMIPNPNPNPNPNQRPA